MHDMTDPQADYTVAVHPEPVGEWLPGWYQSLVDDCHAIITEAVFTSRWALVEGYWMLGRRIVADAGYQRYGRGNGAVLQGLAKDIGLSERTLYYALQFFAKYPHLDDVPEGKNISWNKLVTNYLPGKEEAAELPPVTFDLWFTGFSRRVLALRESDLTQLPYEDAAYIRERLDEIAARLEQVAR